MRRPLCSTRLLSPMLRIRPNSFSSSPPALVQAIDNADSDPASILALVQAGAATLQKIISLINSLKALAASLEAGAAAQPPDVKALLQAFAQELPRRLTEYLLIERLLVVPQAPVLDPSVVEFLVRLRERGLSVATVLGLADTTFDDGSLVDRLVAPHQRRRLHLNAFGRLASDPVNYFADLYGWGQPAFNGELLFARLAHLLDFYEDQLLFEDLLGEPPVLGIPSLHATVGPDPLSPGGPKGVLVTMHRPAVRDYTETFPLGATWSFFVDVKARFEAGLNAGIFPDGRITITPPLGEAHAEASVGLRAQRIDQKPMTLVGVAGIARLELNRFEARAGVKLASALPPGKSEATPIFELRPEGLTCVLDIGEENSFLKTLSGGGRGQSDIPMGAAWSPKAGLKLTGSAAP